MSESRHPGYEELDKWFKHGDQFRIIYRFLTAKDKEWHLGAYRELNEARFFAQFNKQGVLDALFDYFDINEDDLRIGHRLAYGKELEIW